MTTNFAFKWNVNVLDLQNSEDYHDVSPLLLSTPLESVTPPAPTRAHAPVDFSNVSVDVEDADVEIRNKLSNSFSENFTNITNEQGAEGDPLYRYFHSPCPCQLWLSETRLTFYSEDEKTISEDEGALRESKKVKVFDIIGVTLHTVVDTNLINVFFKTRFEAAVQMRSEEELQEFVTKFEDYVALRVQWLLQECFPSIVASQKSRSDWLKETATSSLSTAKGYLSSLYASTSQPQTTQPAAVKGNEKGKGKASDDEEQGWWGWFTGSSGREGKNTVDSAEGKDKVEESVSSPPEDGSSSRSASIPVQRARDLSPIVGSPLVSPVSPVSPRSWSRGDNNVQVPPEQDDILWAITRCVISQSQDVVLREADNKYVIHRGECGRMPKLSPEYAESVVAKTLADKVPLSQYAWDKKQLSSCWSLHHSLFWQQLEEIWEPAITTSPQCTFTVKGRKNPFDFDWHSAECRSCKALEQVSVEGEKKKKLFKRTEREEGTVKRVPSLYSSTCLSYECLPVAFRTLPGGKSETCYGFSIGTCYRSADVFYPTHGWRSNAITNVYWIRPRRVAETQGLTHSPVHCGSSVGEPLCNIFRHGIIGFKGDNERHLKDQTYLFVKLAFEAQRDLKKPMRIVSHNLVNNLTSLIDKEKEMKLRQESHFFNAMERLRKQKEWQQFNLSFAAINLPGNSDQSIYKMSDVDIKDINIGFIQYLQWTIEDATQVIDLFTKKYPTLWVPVGSDAFVKVEDVEEEDMESVEKAMLHPCSLITALTERYPEHVDVYLSLFGNDPSDLSHQKLLEVLAKNVADMKASMVEWGVTDAPYYQLFCRAVMALLTMILTAAYDIDMRRSGSTINPLTPLGNTLQKCVIGVNLLRYLYHAESFTFSGYSCSDYTFYSGLETAPDYGQGRRRFTRATSFLVASLLDYILGVAIFVNCKSGLDRTGIFVGSIVSVVALWEQFPTSRWALHEAILNNNFIRGRIMDAGAIDLNESGQLNAFAQTFTTALPSESEGEKKRERSGSRMGQHRGDISSSSAPTLPSFGQIFPEAESTEDEENTKDGETRRGSSAIELHVPNLMDEQHELAKNEEGANMRKRYNSGNMKINAADGNDQPEEPWVVVSLPGQDAGLARLRQCLDEAMAVYYDGEGDKLSQLAPYIFIVKNALFSYLLEGNTLISLASTGVRGMKYSKHPLIGHLVPTRLQTADSSVTVEVLEKKLSVLGYIVSLNDLGESLLVDSSYLRKS